MDDQQVVGEIDGHDLQDDPAVVRTDPQEAVIEVAVGRDALRLAGSLHGRQQVGSAETVLASGLGEPNCSHAVLLHCTSRRATR